jgi:hypothetical protein
MGLGHTATRLTLFEVGCIVTHAEDICSHLSWAEEYPFLVPDMLEFDVRAFLDQEMVRTTESF